MNWVEVKCANRLQLVLTPVWTQIVTKGTVYSIQPPQIYKQASKKKMRLAALTWSHKPRKDRARFMNKWVAQILAGYNNKYKPSTVDRAPVPAALLAVTAVNQVPWTEKGLWESAAQIQPNYLQWVLVSICRRAALLKVLLDSPDMPEEKAILCLSQALKYGSE